jgi:MFS family permease
MLALVALAELLGMTLWFSATAVAAPIAAEFQLTLRGAAWLTMAVQAGFVCGTLASGLLNLPDRINARVLFGLGALAGAAANLAVIGAGSASWAVFWRFATGAALACVYPPGMKIAAGWTIARRGTALGLVVGALTHGSAAPHLLASFVPPSAWRTVLMIASALAVAGGAIVVLLVRDGPYVTASAPFDPRAARTIVRLPAARLATLGYLGHMWELYAMWAWIGAFAAAGFAARGDGAAEAARWGSIVAFVAVASGAPACVAAGIWGDRLGKARIARAAMIGSAACALATPALYAAPTALLFLLAVIWGATVVADSAQFSALVADASPPEHVGTALTLQTCAGFLLTMLTIRLLPIVADLIGWRWTFVVLAPGPILGVVAMTRLLRYDTGVSGIGFR